QRGLDLDRRDVDAAHLQHVVGAPAVRVVALRIEAVLVPATRPRTLEGVLGPLALVPIHDRRGRSADLQLAELARLGDYAAVVIDEPHLVAGHRLPGGAVAHFARPVGDEDVQHLGRPDAVENLDSGALGPALAETFRQRFACRGAHAQPKL